MNCSECVNYDICNTDDIKGISTTSVCRVNEWNLFKDKTRFIETPLKLGDIVYTYNEYWSECTDVQPFQITNVMISQNKKGVWIKKYRAMLLLNGDTTNEQINFNFDEIGKTIFVTKEQAEKALKEIK